MILNKNHTIIFGVIAFIGVGVLFRNYTQAIKEKNTIERDRIESTERLKRLELDQEQAQADLRQGLEQAKLNRDLEADCQKQISNLRERFNNIEGGGYDSGWGFCEVSYKDTKTGEIEKSDVRDMISVD